MRFRSLVSRDFLRSAGTLSGGTFVSHGLLLATAPVLTRIYDPNEFGALAVYISILAVLALLATLRFDVAIPIPKQQSTAHCLVALTILSVIFFGCVFGLVLAALGDSLFTMVQTKAFKYAGLLLMLGIIADGMMRCLRSWNIRSGNFFAIAQAKVSQSTTVIVTQLIFGCLSFGVVGLVLGDVLSRVVAALVHLTCAIRGNSPPLSKVSLSAMKDAAQSYRRFPLLSTWSSLLMVTIDFAPSILLAVTHGPTVAGLFLMAHRAVMGPMLILSTSFTQVYINEASSTIRKSPADLYKIFWSFAARSALVSVPPILVVALLGPWLFGVVFGQQWQESGDYMRLLAPAVLSQFIAGPVYQTLDLLQKQKWALISNGIGLAVVVSVFFLASDRGVSPSTTIALYSAVTTCFNVTTFLMAAAAAMSLRARSQMPWTAMGIDSSMPCMEDGNYANVKSAAPAHATKNP